jgi:hypothetical protein
LSLGLLCGGCATTPQVKVSAEIVNPEEAKRRSVVVVPDFFMDDPSEADKIAGLLREQLVANGFKVQEAESEAQLVVVPTIERSKPTNTVARPAPRARRPIDVPSGLGQGNMTESANALRQLGFEFATGAAPENLEAGLMVTAVTREAWFQTLADQPSEIPRVWRIVAVTPLEKEDVTAKLVQAVGSKLKELPTGRP